MTAQSRDPKQPCRHALECIEGRTLCGHLMAATRVRHWASQIMCDECRAAGGPDAEVENNPWLKRKAQEIRRIRLIGGDPPAYRGPTPVDIPRLFADFAKRATHDEQRNLLVQMFLHQALLAPDDGGDEPEVLEQKTTALAKHHGLQDALDDIRNGNWED